MVLFRRVLLIGAFLATCQWGQAQTKNYQPQTNPSFEPPGIISASSVPPSLEFQDLNPPGWVSGGDPVGIPGEKGEILDPRFYPPPGWFCTLTECVFET